jgi:hypothetical protein
MMDDNVKTIEAVLESLSGDCFSNRVFIFRIVKGIENTIAHTGGTVGLVGNSIQMPNDMNIEVGQRVDLKWVNETRYGGWVVDKIYNEFYTPYICEFCGAYWASKPRCNKCEEE